MNPGKDPADTASVAPDRRRAGRGAAPAVALVLLAPIVSEVLYGATRISVLPVLVIQVAVWGCGALMIREAIRRRRRGWAGVLLLGAALAVAEECLIQQTSLAPLVGPAEPAYGRAWGVNWVYLLWSLGYESVWVVVLPIWLVELIFPDRRDEPWVGRRGFVPAGLAFLLGSFVAWYSWTQVARTRVFHLPEYQPPLGYVCLAIASIVLLAMAALGRRTSPTPERCAAALSAPAPWLVGLIAFLFGLPWSMLVLLAYGAAPMVPPGVPIIAGLTSICAILFLVTRWTSCPEWNDGHRFAVVFAGILASMAGGFAIFAVGGALRVDWVGKAILNATAVALLGWLGWSVRRDRRKDNLTATPADTRSPAGRPAAGARARL